MQTRTITQVLIYKLIMNPMTSNTESVGLVAFSDDKEKLIDFYNINKTENYVDERWHKSFIKGGPIEWYNPIESFDSINHYGQGIVEEWIDESLLESIGSRFLRIN